MADDLPSDWLARFYRDLKRGILNAELLSRAVKEIAGPHAPQQRISEVKRDLLAYYLKVLEDDPDIRC